MFIQGVYKTLHGVTKLYCCGMCSKDDTCKSVNYQRVAKECKLVSMPLSAWIPTYDTNWDVYTKIGWTLLFRGTRGIGGDIYTAWTNGDSVTEDDVTCMTTDVTSCNQHYRNPIVNMWSSLATTQIKVKYVLYKSEGEVAYIIFNGTGSNATSWFSQENVFESTWDNLKNDTYNYFSASGYNNTRRFYANRNFGGCDVDTAYTVTIATQFINCDFDVPETVPQFLYSTSATYGYPNQMIGMDRADVMAIFVMIG
ncbi:uncharacterized protein LOC123542038 [Mercenaria mercenaria]|uniref:uncharacterized protein LOC123542038 n=1 Tax=Mercenaria mercenaria TaxID=6596 RepID=UPI00234F4830|nr:uncharacterized protein LOC123542038 [Mercenaria mercenaria]